MGGGQFYQGGLKAAGQTTLVASPTIDLKYWYRFPVGFDFGKMTAGKMPGLYGGPPGCTGSGSSGASGGSSGSARTAGTTGSSAAGGSSGCRVAGAVADDSGAAALLLLALVLIARRPLARSPAGPKLSSCRAPSGQDRSASAS